MGKQKPGYVFGWKYGGDGYQLYVQQRTKKTREDDIPSGYDKCSWWPTNKLECATRFKSTEECLSYFREIYWVNENDKSADHFIYGGALQIFMETPSGLCQVKPLEQLPLFDLEALTTIPVFDNRNGETSPSRIDILQEKGFSHDEAKILAAGFILVRYNREEKRVDLATPKGPVPDSWLKGLPEKTYAAAERSLGYLLDAPSYIQVDENGYAERSSHKSIKKLVDAGFEFYRQEGVMKGHGTPRIKIASKNWGTWRKFESGAEVVDAWTELMKNEKALQG